MYLRNTISTRNKKGFTGLEDVFFVLVYLFAAAVLIFIVYYTYSQIKTPMAQALTPSSAVDGAVYDADGQMTFNFTQSGEDTLGGLSIFNVMFPFILIGLIIMTTISAFFIQSHPVFFFISIIILGVVILLGVVFSNIYQQITTDTSFGSTSTNFNIMNLFMKYLPIVVAIVVVITFIVLWAKPGGTPTGL